MILYGSRARGDVNGASDIDLAVDAPDADGRVWMRWMNALDERRSLVRVDLVNLRDAPEELRRQIERDGVTLF